MRQTHLWQEKTVEADGLTTINVRVESPNQERYHLWYRIPTEYNFLITRSCDPFVTATLLLFMRWKVPTIVHGQVSPSLLQNLEEFQAAWSAWEPNKYKPIEISAEIEQEQPPAQTTDKAVVAFSGGVDSCFTVFRHRTNRCGRWQRNLQAGAMIHGLDIPLEEQQGFADAAEKSRKLLASVGVQLIPIATNFRQLPLKWEDAFGAGLASCLMLLQGGYTTGLIASSFPYQALSFPYGSNPVTDWMLSSNAFQIVHDGAAFPRLDKIGEIANWEEAMQSLRVCWEGTHKDRNCGRCEKCIRTILNFRILGVGLPECFEQDVTNEQIQTIRVTSGPLTEMERVLEAAKVAGLSASWVQALEICIRRNQLLNVLETSRTTLESTLKKSRMALRQRVPAPVKKQVQQLRSLLPKLKTR
jgi:hypothetical protein